MIDIAEMIQRERADVYNAMAWARLWKQVAKAYRGRFKAMVATLKLANAANDLARDCYELSQATADRRLALLKRVSEVINLWDMGCPICGGWNHHKDCELAKELGDA